MTERIRTDPPEDAEEEDTGDSQTEPAPGVVWMDRASLPHGVHGSKPGASVPATPGRKTQRSRSGAGGRAAAA